MNIPNLNNKERARLTNTVSQCLGMLLQDLTLTPRTVPQSVAWTISLTDAKLIADHFLKSLGGMDADDAEVGARMIAYRGRVIIAPKQTMHLAMDGDGEVLAFSKQPEFCNCDNVRCPGAWSAENGALCKVDTWTEISKQESQDSCVYVGQQ